MRCYVTARVRDGRHVALRPLDPKDAHRVQEACSDPETIAWLGGEVINERYSLEHARGFIERALSGAEAGTHMSWAIADLETDELLGHIGLIGSGGELTDSAALGYWTHPAARGTGIMTAAAVAVVAEAFSPAADGGGGMRRLTLVVAVGNIASQRVAEAAGFQRTGRRRESDLLIDGTYTDEFTYDLLAKDPR